MSRCKNCESCKNAIISTGAHTGAKYLECGLEKTFAETASLEELLKLIEHPELKPCEYCKGTPADGGVTYDD